MASRMSIHIYNPKYFMAVRNCINTLVIYYLKIFHTSLLTCSYIGELLNDRKLKCENLLFIVFILIVRRVLF